MLCSQAFGVEPPELRFSPSLQNLGAGHFLVVEPVDNKVEPCQPSGNSPVVRRRIRFKVIGPRYYWFYVSDNTISYTPENISEQLTIDVLFLGPKSQELAKGTNNFSVAENVFNADWFKELHFTIGGIKSERTHAFSGGEPGASARVVACLGACTRTEVATLRCNAAGVEKKEDNVSRGGEYAPTVINSSGKGKSNAGSEFDRLQAEKTHLRQQVDSLQRQLAEKSKVADSEQQQKWKAQEDLRLKEIAEATKKLDAVTQSKVELEELLRAANAELKEAKAKLSPKEFSLRLVRGGDEEQGKDVSPGTLSARFLDRCQDYAGKTSDIHGLTSPRVAGGYNTRTWEGEFSMEREGNKHCLVLTESFADGRPPRSIAAHFSIQKPWMVCPSKRSTEGRVRRKRP